MSKKMVVEHDGSIRVTKTVDVVYSREWLETAESDLVAKIDAMKVQLAEINEMLGIK